MGVVFRNGNVGRVGILGRGTRVISTGYKGLQFFGFEGVLSIGSGASQD